MLVNGVDERLKFDRRILVTMKSHVQDGPLRKESGGVLIGRESIEGDLIVVEHITVPMRADRRERHRFYRRDVGHVDYYSRLNEANTIYAYIGEWHTHPQKVPCPSGVDLDNWRQIWREDYARSVQYHAIAGTSELGFWSIGPTAAQVELAAMCKWNDLGL